VEVKADNRDFGVVPGGGGGINDHRLRFKDTAHGDRTIECGTVKGDEPWSRVRESCGTTMCQFKC
jgi:hypothetical protein